MAETTTSDELLDRLACIDCGHVGPAAEMRECDAAPLAAGSPRGVYMMCKDRAACQQRRAPAKTANPLPVRLTPSKNIGPVVTEHRDHESTRWTVEAGTLAFTSCAFCISMELRGDSKSTKPTIDKIAHRFNTQPALVAACQAQRLAIDHLFALLITLTRAPSYEGELFFPSKSGEPWHALELGNAALRDAGQAS